MMKWQMASLLINLSLSGKAYTFNAMISEIMEIWTVFGEAERTNN